VEDDLAAQQVWRLSKFREALNQLQLVVVVPTVVQATRQRVPDKERLWSLRESNSIRYIDLQSIGHMYPMGQQASESNLKLIGTNTQGATWPAKATWNSLEWRRCVWLPLFVCTASRKSHDSHMELGWWNPKRLISI
jgi:hypothetical protein